MSHEMVHLFKPAIYNSWKYTSCLEEGFATFNSVYECQFLKPPYNTSIGITSKYKQPLEILKKLGADHDVFKFVKLVRTHGYTLSNVAEQWITENCKSWNKEDIQSLVNKFYI